MNHHSSIDIYQLRDVRVRPSNSREDPVREAVERVDQHADPQDVLVPDDQQQQQYDDEEQPSEPALAAHEAVDHVRVARIADHEQPGPQDNDGKDVDAGVGEVAGGDV